MDRTRIKVGGSLLGLLGIAFVIIALTLLQPPAPPKPQVSGNSAVIAAFVVLPFVVLGVVILLTIRSAYRTSTVDSSGRRILGGRMRNGVEAEIRQRAASDAFSWLMCAMSLDIAASQLLGRQPLQSLWWPAVAGGIFLLAITLRRKQLT
jgi:hypothetical protein